MNQSQLTLDTRSSGIQGQVQWHILEVPALVAVVVMDLVQLDKMDYTASLRSYHVKFAALVSHSTNPPKLYH